MHKRIARIIILVSLLAALAYLVFAYYTADKYYFLCPIKYNGSCVIRSDPGGDGSFASSRNGRRIHQGIDLLADTGTPVLAVRSGLVISAKRNRGMGNFVILRHSPSLITIYGHLSRIDVVKNQCVRQGEVIGAVGKTGNARNSIIQPHLHFEIRKNGVPQNPLEYLD
jgi:murein DD-endopeptidase MepM/ murein hydrolase activator NlpD